jgi:hypothetical protein
VARTLGIGMRIAGWGGFLLSILVWFSLFPPSGNPVIGEEHMAFAFSLLLLMFLHTGNRFGWAAGWRHTPVAAALNSATTIKLRPTFKAGIHRF